MLNARRRGQNTIVDNGVAEMYTIRTRIFKFCKKVTQYMLYTITTRIYKL